jgi:branched-chain amino acid transport system ATP-binding protein
MRKGFLMAAALALAVPGAALAQRRRRARSGRHRQDGPDEARRARRRHRGVRLRRVREAQQVFGQVSVRDNLIVAAQEFKGTLPGAAARQAGRRPRSSCRDDHALPPDHVAHLPAGSLSYGQQKLIDIAMTFMASPLLVLLDGPAPA